jgi:hypothetical protein
VFRRHSSSRREGVHGLLVPQRPDCFNVLGANVRRRRGRDRDESRLTTVSHAYRDRAGHWGSPLVQPRFFRFRRGRLGWCACTRSNLHMSHHLRAVSRERTLFVVSVSSVSRGEEQVERQRSDGRIRHAGRRKSFLTLSARMLGTKGERNAAVSLPDRARPARACRRAVSRFDRIAIRRLIGPAPSVELRHVGLGNHSLDEVKPGCQSEASWAAKG